MRLGFGGSLCFSLFSCFVVVYSHIVCLFQALFCVRQSVFYQLVFPNSMFTPFFYNGKGYVSSGEIALNNNHYYYCVMTSSFHYSTKWTSVSRLSALCVAITVKRRTSV